MSYSFPVFILLLPSFFSFSSLCFFIQNIQNIIFVSAAESCAARYTACATEGDPPHARPLEPYEDLNENGVYDSTEPSIDFDNGGSRNFLDEYGDQSIKSPENERFGRRFRIVKFRWLMPEEA